MGKFVKGQSGNPGGRPKLINELRERALKAVDEVVLKYWRDQVETDGPNAAKCSELLAAYGLGKPSQQVEHTGEGGGPVGIQIVVEGVEPGGDEN
jgi:hypothetical protein